MDNKNFVVWMLEGIFLSFWGLMMVFIFRPKANPHVGGSPLGLLLRYVIAATIILIVVGVAASRWGAINIGAPFLEKKEGRWHNFYSRKELTRTETGMSVLRHRTNLVEPL